MILSRRSLFSGLLAVAAGPAIVRASSLMQISTTIDSIDILGQTRVSQIHVGAWGESIQEWIARLERMGPLTQNQVYVLQV